MAVSTIRWTLARTPSLRWWTWAGGAAGGGDVVQFWAGERVNFLMADLTLTPETGTSEHEEVVFEESFSFFMASEDRVDDKDVTAC